MKVCCQLGKPLAHKAAVIKRTKLTSKVIPVPNFRVRQTTPKWHGPSVHVDARFPGISVRFTWSPVGVNWKWAIIPYELVGVRVPFEADPNLLHRRGVFPCKLQDEFVFFSAVDFHKFSFLCLAVGLGRMPGHDGAANQITVTGFEPGPAIRTRGTLKRVEIRSLVQ